MQSKKETIKITYNAEWEEYQVELWVDGKIDDRATYFTSDWCDAEDTARAMELSILERQVS